MPPIDNRPKQETQPMLKDLTRAYVAAFNANLLNDKVLTGIDLIEWQGGQMREMRAYLDV